MLYDIEAELRPDACYLDLHGPDASADLFLDAGMRRTAASWLVEVSFEFGLHQETLFLANALLDRFLSSAKARNGRGVQAAHKALRRAVPAHASRVPGACC